MNFVFLVNILLIILILYNIYNLIFLQEGFGLPGCPATSGDLEGNRRRGAKRGEINNVIKDLKAEINQLRKNHIFIRDQILRNSYKLEVISKAAVDKARRNKDKMDKIKN